MLCRQIVRLLISSRVHLTGSRNLIFTRLILRNKTTLRRSNAHHHIITILLLQVIGQCQILLMVAVLIHFLLHDSLLRVSGHTLIQAYRPCVARSPRCCFRLFLSLVLPYLLRIRFLLVLHLNLKLIINSRSHCSIAHVISFL